MSDWLHPMAYVVVVWRFMPSWAVAIVLMGVCIGLLIGIGWCRWEPTFSTGRF